MIPSVPLAVPTRRVAAWLVLIYALMLLALLADYYSHFGETEVMPNQLIGILRVCAFISWLITAFRLVVVSRSGLTEARDRRALAFATFFGSPSRFASWASSASR